MKSQSIKKINFLSSSENPSAEKKIDISSIGDEKVWEKFRGGDEEVFIYIYKEYANTLYNYGTQFTRDTDLIKDCLQDFFIYLREKRSHLGSVVSIKFYLLKSFRRRVIDYVKQSEKRHGRFSESNESLFPIEISHEIKYINQQTLDNNLEKLEKGLSELNMKEREAIYIYYFQNLTYEQIADFFNFTHVSSARRLVYRALSKLKNHFGFFTSSLIFVFLDFLKS